MCPKCHRFWVVGIHLSLWHCSTFYSLCRNDNCHPCWQQGPQDLTRHLMNVEWHQASPFHLPLLHSCLGAQMLLVELAVWWEDVTCVHMMLDQISNTYIAPHCQKWTHQHWLQSPPSGLVLVDQWDFQYHSPASLSTEFTLPHRWITIHVCRQEIIACNSNNTCVTPCNSDNMRNPSLHFISSGYACCYCCMQQ